MKKGKNKSIKGFLAAIPVLLGAVWLYGWYGPAGKYVPLGLYMTRPELRSVSKNLLLGNPQHYFQSPVMLDIAQKAWNGDDITYGLQALLEEAKTGKTIYYEVYSKEEQAKEPDKSQVGLYCLRGDESETKPFILLLAGGGFSSVCTMEESLPVGAWFQEQGYTVFMGTYRLSGTFGVFQQPELLAEDVAQEISYIREHAKEWNLNPNRYVIGGFSAGSCTAFVWCNQQYGYAQYGLPAPETALFMYGIAEDYMDGVEVPSFVRSCIGDQYFPVDISERYVKLMQEKEIPYDFAYVDALHGFGLGTDTAASGWTKDALEFWQSLE